MFGELTIEVTERSCVSMRWRIDMVRHAHRHKRNVFSRRDVYVWWSVMIISWRLWRSIATILPRRARSRHDYDRDVVMGDQRTAKCECRWFRQSKEKKNVWIKRVVVYWLLACCLWSICYHMSKSENIITQFEQGIYSENKLCQMSLISSKNRYSKIN